MPGAAVKICAATTILDEFTETSKTRLKCAICQVCILQPRCCTARVLWNQLSWEEKFIFPAAFSDKKTPEPCPSRWEERSAGPAASCPLLASSWRCWTWRRSSALRSPLIRSTRMPFRRGEIGFYECRWGQGLRNIVRKRASKYCSSEKTTGKLHILKLDFHERRQS